MGTTVDESSEDFSNIQVSLAFPNSNVAPLRTFGVVIYCSQLNTSQIPSAWKQILEDPSTVQIFFDYYENNEPNVSKEVRTLVFLLSLQVDLALKFGSYIVVYI